jgi:hypothetical protein
MVITTGGKRMKAILEMEMPESCDVCKLYYKKIIYVDTFYMCSGLSKEIGYNEFMKRHADCPLKEARDEAGKEVQ